VPTLTIDDKVITVPTGATVLQAIRQAGARLQTLCYLEGLPPYGACRLCMVELTAPVSQVIAACAYPAAEGLVVDTRGPRATAVRNLMLEFLLARCPDAEAIRSLANEAGVASTRFTTDGRPDELCVLCGLCVRVCRDAVGAAAIGFTGRGAGRAVTAPFHVQAEACIGCGACAAVCPTGAVRIEDAGGQRVLHTWNTTVPLKRCPSCGQPYAPEPMAFLRELIATGGPAWGVCPACRRKEAAAQLKMARDTGRG